MSETPPPINLEDFRVPAKQAAPNKPKRLPRHRRGEWFLKGPIPGVWVQEAACLGGKAFQVAIAAWHVGELVKSRTFKLSRKMLSQFGVKRTAARRGLEALQKAGLVAVVRGQGRSPLVTILEAGTERKPATAAETTDGLSMQSLQSGNRSPAAAPGKDPSSD